MSHLYYEDNFELEYESEMFIKNKFGASLLTNFDKTDKFIIQQCIIDFDLYDNIFIDSAYDNFNKKMNNHLGVYINRPCDLSDFWQRFDELKGDLK